jgi:hypothetical protein
MRAILVLLGLSWWCAQTAHAETVLVLAEPSTELDAALRVVMASRGVSVAGAPRPEGGLRLERAAMAQRTAVQVGAHAAVWIDDSDVCAVTADGHDFRHAPLPPEAASPRVFAAIATSLLDEMIRPESWQGFDVNVHVEVTPRGSNPQRVAMIEGPALVAPGLVDVAAPSPTHRAHAGRTLIEIGPMLSPITIGLQGALSFSVSDKWRLGLEAGINQTLDGEYTLGIGAVELRRVGRGRSRHWDVGPEVGYATDGRDPAAYVGFRIARTWELSSTALSLALTPLLLAPLDDANTPPVFPGIYTSLRWQVPL